MPGELIHAAAPPGRADGFNGVFVRRHVALRIAGRDGRFAQHIEGVEKAARLERPRMLQRLLDGLARYKLPSEHPHRQIHRRADYRLPAAGESAGQRRGHAGLAMRGGELAGDEQAPSGSIDEPGWARANVRAPIAVGELIADEEIARLPVGDA